MIAIRSSRIQGLGPLALAALLLFALTAEVAVGDAVASGRANLVALFVIVAVSGLCFAFWKQAVYGVLVMVFVEGYFRNLLDDPAVLLLKDLSILAIYARVLADRVQRRVALIPASPINLPLAVFACIVLVQMANPHVTSFEQTLVGVRAWIYYVPLYFVAREMISTEADLRRFVWFIVACAVPVGALGVYQYLLGSNAYANLGPGFASATFVTGDGESILFRPNATFAWASHFALFLSLTTLLCLGLLLSSRGYMRWILLSMFVALIAVNVIENQRSLLVLTPPLMLLIVALRRSAGAWVTITLAVVLGIAVIALIASPGTLLRIDGLIRNDDGIFRVRTMTYAEHFRMALSSPIGFGTGATAIGTRYVVGDIPLFVEFSLAKVAGDLSLVGLAAYLWLFAVLCKTTLAAHRWATHVRVTGVASIAGATLSFQLMAIYTGYELAVVAVPFWLLSGAMLTFASNRPRPSVVGAVEAGR